MVGYWENFIRTGDPNGEGLPAWEESTDGTNVMILGNEQKMAENGGKPYAKTMAGAHRSPRAQARTRCIYSRH